MARWLNWLEKRRPKVIAKLELQLLINLTSKVFQEKRRCLWLSPYDRALQSYARYTRELLLNRDVGDDASLLSRMREESCRMGNRLRRATGLKDREELERLVFFLYKNIGIDMSGEIPGEICVSRCYFSQFYDPEMCQVISGMDGGIISGICDGGELRFTERITEGCPCCKAYFSQDKDVKQ